MLVFWLRKQVACFGCFKPDVSYSRSGVAPDVFGNLHNQFQFGNLVVDRQLVA